MPVCLFTLRLKMLFIIMGPQIQNLRRCCHDRQTPNTPPPPCPPPPSTNKQTKLSEIPLSTTKLGCWLHANLNLQKCLQMQVSLFHNAKLRKSVSVRKLELLDAANIGLKSDPPTPDILIMNHRRFLVLVSVALCSL